MKTKYNQLYLQVLSQNLRIFQQLGNEKQKDNYAAELRQLRLPFTLL